MLAAAKLLLFGSTHCREPQHNHGFPLTGHAGAATNRLLFQQLLSTSQRGPHLLERLLSPPFVVHGNQSLDAARSSTGARLRGMPEA